MPLKNAPLVEVIFEIRWGERSINDLRQLAFSFSDDELSFFPGEFRAKAAKAGFSHFVSKSSLPANLQPHQAKYQFWTGAQKWPCLQLGLGIVTANQTNDGYSWESFKKTCLTALTILDETHPRGLAELPGIGVELRYQDGFPFEEEESPDSFIREKLKINLGIPTEFSESQFFDGKPDNHSVSFGLRMSEPKGLATVVLERGTISDQPGFIMSTITRSADEDSPSFRMQDLEEWLEKSHDVQRHTFDTLIKPAYRSTFE